MERVTTVCMRQRILPWAVALFVAGLPGIGWAADFFLERVATGLDRPVFAAAAPGDSSRLFILEQWDDSVSPPVGRVRILDLATLTLLPTPFLEIEVSNRGEGGLLGLAFHPDYATNGLFYVYYQERLDGGRDTFVERFQVSANPDLADVGTRTPVLEIQQPQTNHNAGWIDFGPDDLLYVALGDGGGGNDSGTGHTPGKGNAQDNDNLLGTIIRIDVDGDDFPADPARNYAIPGDNPFVGVAGRDEIFVYGLRNPFRCAFDRATGDLYIGDVGQNVREEVDVVPAGTSGANYGWRLREGTIATPSGGVGGPQPLDGVNPIYDYAHGIDPFEGFSVIGGYVYRGPVPSLQGRYFFADNVIPQVFSLVWDGSDPSLNDGTNFTDLVNHTGTPEFTPDAGTIDGPSSFGEDAAGNLYLVDLDGDVFRLTPSGQVPSLSPAGLAALALLIAFLGARRALA